MYHADDVQKTDVRAPKDPLERRGRRARRCFAFSFPCHIKPEVKKSNTRSLCVINTRTTFGYTFGYK